MAALKLFLFGPPRLELDGRSIEAKPRKALALLVYLAVTGRSHSREALANLLWPDGDREAARASLRRTAHRLQQSLKIDVLDASADAIGLAPALELWLDVHAFRAEVVAAETAELDGAWLARLDAAVELFADDFLAGFTLADSPAFDEWQFFQSDELRRALVTLLDRLDESYASRGEYDRALPYVRRRLALDPLDEATHRRLMQLYTWAGQPATALRQYQECARILAEEMGVPPDEETEALLEAIRNRRLSPPLPFVTAALPLVDAGPRLGATTSIDGLRLVDGQQPALGLRSALPHNLPAQASPFVGRDEELALLRRLLEEEPACRLLALVGQGGIGKTRLALQVAEELVAAWPKRRPFPDGIFFVPLAAVSRSQEMIYAIGEAVGVPFQPLVPPQQQLLDGLHNKTLLLVLDSFEHLIAGADLLSALLGAAQGVKLLVTSLEGLDLQEAWFFPLAGLAVPGLVPSAHRPAAAFDAVRFFDQCARRARTTFVLAGELEHVVHVCRLVEGMPLAIELAAAWLRVLPVARIAEEIARGLDILTTRYQNVAPRHRSMRAVLDHSWALLDEQEQAVLQRLSVFQGGFRLEAATAVAEATLPLLAALVDKALLRVDEHGRYQMHGLLRQFALEKLCIFPDEQNAIRNRHSAYYFDFMRVRGPGLTGPRQPLLLAELEDDLENLRAAWQWAIDQNHLEDIDQTTISFWRIFWTRGRILEVEESLTEAIFRLRSPSAPDGQLLYDQVIRRLITQRALCYYFLGDYSQARGEFERLVAGARRMSDKLTVAEGLAVLGAMAVWQARSDEAKTMLAEAIAIFAEIGDIQGLADVSQELSRIGILTGDYDQAEADALESLRLSRQVERPDWIAYALVTLASTHLYRGAYAAAQQYCEEGLALFDGVGHQLGISLGYGGLGWLAWAEGRNADAERLAGRALAICRQIGHRLQISHRLCALAQIAVDAEDYDRALAYAEEGVTLATAVGCPPFMVHSLCCMAEVARNQGRLAAARNLLTRGLQLASAGKVWPRLNIVFYYYALLLEAEAEEAGRPSPSLARELLAVVAQDPRAWSVFRSRASARLQPDAPPVMPRPTEALASTLLSL
jgi:predicted ATPase/DNA-binding SARP family transcriptional activator